MKRIKKVVIVLVSAALLSATGLAALSLYTKSIINDVVGYVKQNVVESKISNSWITTMTVESIGLLNPVSGDLKICIKATDFDKLAEYALNDSGLHKDYESLILDGKDVDNTTDMLFRYTNAVIESKLCARDFEFTVSAPINGAANFSALNSVIQAVNQFTVQGILDGLQAVDESINEIIEQELVIAEDIPIVDSDTSFIYEENDARFLVSNIRVQTGRDALDSIGLISDINRQIVTNDYVVFLEYDVTNLSNKAAIIHNFFKLAKDGRVFEVRKSIAGLQGVAEIQSNATTSMTCFLAGPDDSILYWYDESICGSYEINIVQ